ncbi:MAG: hypothetical protein ACYTEQ_30815 [Planctomycetota bacterium]|jgi:hypothetical protein
MTVLPHSIEWQEEELTVRLLFLSYLPDDPELLYAEVYISDETSMRYGHQLHVSRLAFREITHPENPNHKLMHHIVEPIIHIYNEKTNRQSSNAGSKELSI